jgi:hypothetical protein
MGVHLVVQRCQEPKKQTQGNHGIQRKLAADCRRIIRRAAPAVHKGHSRKGPDRDSAAREAPKGTF